MKLVDLIKIVQFNWEKISSNKLTKINLKQYDLVSTLVCTCNGCVRNQFS